MLNFLRQWVAKEPKTKSELGASKCRECNFDLLPNEAGQEICWECWSSFNLDICDTTPPSKYTTLQDTKRLDWLDKHCTIRISRKGNIKIRISAESNGVNCNVLRDYIDHLMEQGA